MKDNIELSREVLDAFGSSNINGTLVTVGSVSSDRKNATIYMGRPEALKENRMKDIGSLNVVGDVTNFNIGAENYTIINMQNGFQAFKNYIDYFVSYTNLPNYTEINYIDKDHKISIKYHKNEENGLSQIINVDSMFYGELKHERNFKLETCNDSISYNYYECYHDQSNSSGPAWYFTVDTKRNRYSNWGKKGEGEFGSPLNLDLSQAQKKALEQLKVSEVMSDIAKLKEVNHIKEFDDIIKVINELEQINLKK